MAKEVKALEKQIASMAARWPQFEVVPGLGPQTAVWFGDLKGLERTFRLSIEYGMPMHGEDELHRMMPVVRVLNPSLVMNFDAEEEAPLPHVYFQKPDYRLSPLCLFDPEANEWDQSMLIADTTVPWAIRWLASYEMWEATGRWIGGGRHYEGERPDNVG